MLKQQNRKEYLDKIRSISKQPNHFFTTAKTQKFEDFEKINVDDLKLIPILEQTGTYLYYRSKVVKNYPKPRVRNEFTISDIWPFLVC